MDTNCCNALLYNVTAHLREPMCNLYMVINHLAPADERSQDAKLDSQTAVLDQSYYQLLRLVNNLSMFQSMNKQLLLLNQDIAALIHSVYQQAESLARYRNLTVYLRCPMARHICAFSLEDVQQLLWQLLSNAFKFTPSGGSITLELARTQGQIQLSVTDDGPGIQAEERETLFQRWQLQTPVYPPHGAGLGLSICQGIARQHDGTLTLDESVSGGCRFVFSMPDRMVNTGRIAVSDISRDYAGGFDPCRIALADALPAEAFRSF